MDKNEKKIGQQKISRMCQEGKSYADAGKLEEAFECYRNAFTEAEQLQNDTAMCSCAFNLGALCVLKRKDYKQGVEYLEKAVDKNGENGDNAEVFFLLGQGYEQLQDGNKAYENYTKALKKFAENKNIKKEVDTLEKMVHVSEKQNKSQQVLHHLNELVHICDVLNNGESSDASLHTQLKRLKFMVKKAHVLKSLNDLKKSKDIAQDCLEELLKLGDMKQAKFGDIHGVYNKLGLLLISLKEYEPAVECFQKVLKMVPEHCKLLMAKTKWNLGCAYYFLGMYPKSFLFSQEAADLFASLGRRNCKGRCYCLKGFALLQLNKPYDASVALHLAHDAAKEADDVQTQWQALEGLGTVNQLLEDFKASVDFFRQAFTSAGKENNKEAQDQIMQELERALCQLPPTPSGATEERSNRQKTKGLHVSRTGTLLKYARVTFLLPHLHQNRRELSKAVDEDEGDSDYL